MNKKAFITGITGQDGAYLSRLLLEEGYEVHGGLRRIGVIGTGRLDELDILNDIQLHDLELLEITNIQRVLDTVNPDEIYNLAAQSFVGASFEQPIYTADVDGIGVMRMLEAVRSRHSDAAFYQASTSEMFGKVQEVPQTENTAFYPRSPYGVAKLLGHWSTVNYRESFGLRACSGILFNHESPLRGKEFVTRKITLAFARIATGQQKFVELGNLDAKRDWGFAGDFVRGMWQMLQREAPADYVLATGEMRSIREFVEVAAGFHGWEIEWTGKGTDEVGINRKTGDVLVKVNPAFYRPAEVEQLCGDPSKAEKELGWSRKVSFRELVEMMCEADIKRSERKSIPY
ncbi:MAG: GDP-mannose 4,6-dehydratase [Cyanobacteria bacterium J06638_22]